ncbi:hypothetical protein ID867_04615 [Streptomyces parvulus]|nr:hypothetical protein [Streptomyces parvulus]
MLESAPTEMARQKFVALLASGQRMLGALREFGTVHCAVGLHRDDVRGAAGGGAQPLLSLLTVTWRDTSAAPRAATVARVAAELVGHEHIEYVDLPTGPLTLSESVLRPAADSGLPQLPLLQIHARLPHPTAAASPSSHSAPPPPPGGRSTGRSCGRSSRRCGSRSPWAP